MANYIESLNIEAPEAANEDAQSFYCEGASRLFDLLCDVEENFFASANADPSDLTFDGNDIDMLRLPPFVANSITQVLIDDEVFDADDYKLRKEFLIYKDGTFDRDSEIVVTARWGFIAIPPEVKLVVQELANYLFRNKDPMFAKISDVEIETELSPTTNAIIKKFRDKYGRSAN